jgi:hypothetical protein
MSLSLDNLSMKKIVIFILLVCIGIPVKAVEIIFNNNHYNVSLTYLLISVFSILAFAQKQEIKNIFKFTLNKYKRRAMSLLICLFYIVIPYCIVLLPFVLTRAYISDQIAILLFVLGISGVIGLIIKETIRKKFS